MVGNEDDAVDTTPEEGSVPTASETTSIHFPARAVEQAIPPNLSAEELSAVEALPQGSALLIAHSGPNQGARFLLDSDVTLAGRHPDADVFLDDVTVSRRHVEFRREGNGFRVVDAGSLNGTYVNGDRVDSLLLRSGNEVQIGKFRLTYYASSAA
ncbi:pSer/pThr/pTyr-binding forkhead associated (FHA) protein [Psychromicrobium silvestre]|uniref:PSer/pThr/pTyr-binding forkhead associated (FHA) protein n=1 Tax=Psychromicrobium silvestre TaxID=1645614 RepID=A0A7Y9LQW2_9MICC|nr:FHA domain-containing protein [Psychromicrobium silvestre]NYE93940.1 pSer/pThr/pTyr-binding forkhead associated (FHA) protein [Psychromicrobium silvestre]